MGETFPEGTSQSDPSAVPPLDRKALEDVPPEIHEKDEAVEGAREPTPNDEPTVEEEPENQQTG